MLLLQKFLHEWEKSQHDEGRKIIPQVYFNSWQFESYDSTKLTMYIFRSISVHFPVANKILADGAQ